MDNQQRSLEVRLSWLGGIIDGEGHVTATIGHKQTRHGYDHVRRFTPIIGIVNTDENIIKEACSILDASHLAYWMKGRQVKNHPTWKYKWEIHISGMKRCLRAIKVLKHYVRSEKQNRMEAMEQWIEHRLGEDQKKPYTEKDHQFLGRIRQNLRPSRGHTPPPVINTGEDMVHAAANAG